MGLIGPPTLVLIYAVLILVTSSFSNLCGGLRIESIEGNGPRTDFFFIVPEVVGIYPPSPYLDSS